MEAVTLFVHFDHCSRGHPVLGQVVSTGRGIDVHLGTERLRSPRLVGYEVRDFHDVLKARLIPRVRP